MTAKDWVEIIGAIAAAVALIINTIDTKKIKRRQKEAHTRQAHRRGDL